MLSELLKGNSPIRAFMHEELNRIAPLSGYILDLGGYETATYWDYLSLKNDGCEVISIDFAIANRPKVVADLEVGLPLKSSTVDSVVLFNVLEHIFNYQELVSEIKRVLKPSGKVFCFVPYLKEIHADPHDYFRYSHSALEEIFQRSGFRQIQISEKGGIFTASFHLAGVGLKLKPLKITANLIALGLDYMVKIIFGSRFEKSYVLGYFVVAVR